MIGFLAAVIRILVAVIEFSEPPFGLWAGGTRRARDPNGPRGDPLWGAQGPGPIGMQTDLNPNPNPKGPGPPPKLTSFGLWELMTFGFGN